MDNVTKNRWQVRIAASIIFVLGFAAGILALNVYRTWAARDRGPGNRFEVLAEPRPDRRARDAWDSGHASPWRRRASYRPRRRANPWLSGSADGRVR